MATGYTTLYGDMAGGFAVIKDVPKTLVYKITKYRNAQAGFDLIPAAIIDKPPSAAQAIAHDSGAKLLLALAFPKNAGAVETTK